MADNHQPLAASRRLDSTTKQARVRAAINDLAASGAALNVAALARRAKVSRRFIYDHPELRAEAEQQATLNAARDSAAVSAHTGVTTASLRADLANANAANQRLHSELAALRQRLGHALGQDVLAEIAGDEATDIAAISAPRVAELEQALFETQEALTQRTEDLEAARRINRELLERLNRRALVLTPVNPGPGAAHTCATRIRTSPTVAHTRNPRKGHEQSPRPRTSTCTPTSPSKSRRSHEPPRSAPSPADTDRPTALLAFLEGL